MACILTSSILFFIAIVLHMVWCRWKGIRTIAITPFFCISAFVFCALVYLETAVLPAYGGQLSLKWTSLALFIALVPFYISFYHMIVINSPTRLMLDLCQDQGFCTRRELLDHLIRHDFFKSRLEALVESGVVEKNGPVYRMSPRGRLIGSVLAWYQKTVGRPKGG